MLSLDFGINKHGVIQRTVCGMHRNCLCLHREKICNYWRSLTWLDQGVLSRTCPSTKESPVKFSRMVLPLRLLSPDISALSLQLEEPEMTTAALARCIVCLISVLAWKVLQMKS